MPLKIFSIIDPRFDTLFEQARAVTSALDGRFSATTPPALTMNDDAGTWIQSLYHRIEQRTPEAGRSYWLTRTWELLCWQPIYLSFISVYTIGGVPPLNHIAQYQQDNFVAGYSFDQGQWVTGEHRELIQHCANHLLVLFEHYRASMEAWARIRPGFTHRLLADEVLSQIANLRKQCRDMSDANVIAEARLWLSALGLSEKLLDSYKWSERRQGLRLVRSSCCQVYRCEGARLCCNCPRRAHNQQQPPYLSVVQSA